MAAALHHKLPVITAQASFTSPSFLRVVCAACLVRKAPGKKVLRLGKNVGKRGRGKEVRVKCSQRGKERERKDGGKEGI